MIWLVILNLLVALATLSILVGVGIRLKMLHSEFESSNFAKLLKQFGVTT